MEGGERKSPASSPRSLQLPFEDAPDPDRGRNPTQRRGPAPRLLSPSPERKGYGQMTPLDRARAMTESLKKQLEAVSGRLVEREEQVKEGGRGGRAWVRVRGTRGATHACCGGVHVHSLGLR